jgi:type II secretory pathway pseudopilin PulG
MDAVDIFYTIIAIALVAGIAYVAIVEWLKATTEQRLNMVDTLVEAAQQHLWKKSGAERRAWVIERLEKRFPGLDLEEASDLIESAVFRLRQRSGAVFIEQPAPEQDERGLHWFDGSGRHN